MYWFVGFATIFILGGMAGLLLGNPPADFQIHNSLFLVAHFHTMVIGAAIFGTFAGYTYWFPKITGFRLNDRLGKVAFWLWFVGFFVAFAPMYLLGLMGATRRLDHYASSTGWQPLYITCAVGLCIILSGMITQVVQVVVSVREKHQRRDTTGDPWDGRTLEWSTPSPPPFYNFAVIPVVTTREEWWHMKQNGEKPSTDYKDIELPKNTGAGVYISLFALLFGFAMVWYIYWLAIASVIGIIICLTIRSFDEHTEYVIPAAEVARMEAAHGRG
jgi:cytochrome o ubiquinol oxidase subunit 1